MQKTLAELQHGWQQRTLREALDEVAREVQVRERCFPRWITEGRVSESEAKDRLQRLLRAASILSALSIAPEEITDTILQLPKEEEEGTPF